MVIDSWTGQPVGHIDNPWMRAFNVVTVPDDWRTRTQGKLNISGWRGLSIEERFYWFCRIQSRRIEFIQRHWLTTTLKQMEKILDKPKYKYILGKLEHTVLLVQTLV